MGRKMLDLIADETSPLFRIMWVYNLSDPTRRRCANNICAFHVGGGFVLSVAHNLFAQDQPFISIPDAIYNAELRPILSAVERLKFENVYVLDQATGRRHFTSTNQSDIKELSDLLTRHAFDTRFITLANKGFCSPHLVVQFRGNHFYADESLTRHFDADHQFAEPSVNRHTFMIELKLVEAFPREDVALYQAINTPSAVLARLPSVDIDYSLYGDGDLHCLQSAPYSELGRMLNRAQVEGVVENFAMQANGLGGMYSLEGTRYLIKGYFRFGSSGAPYLRFDNFRRRFRANAVQSQACPIQLTINDKKDGNLQWVNALATPLALVRDRLKAHLKS